MKSIAGTHVLTDLQSALDKVEAAIPPGMRKFLDRLPALMTAKTPLGKRRGTQVHEITTRLFETSMSQRVVSMRYHSSASGYPVDGVNDIHLHPTLPRTARVNLVVGFLRARPDVTR